MTDKNVKSFYHFICYFSFISLLIQIILTNVFNIYSLKDSILNRYTIKITDNNKDEKITKNYSILTQIGIISRKFYHNDKIY